MYVYYIYSVSLVAGMETRETLIAIARIDHLQLDCSYPFSTFLISPLLYSS